MCLWGNFFSNCLSFLHHRADCQAATASAHEPAFSKLMPSICQPTAFPCKATGVVTSEEEQIARERTAREACPRRRSYTSCGPVGLLRSFRRCRLQEHQTDLTIRTALGRRFLSPKFNPSAKRIPWGPYLSDLETYSPDMGKASLSQGSFNLGHSSRGSTDPVWRIADAQKINRIGTY
ncbi:hypothetical protein EJ06DRAFT_252969 [Trichodelitschia bisporula]|uniref:Uncharacterized protein n=1 Tax=Trichodelitschia bisporula TaxID=703511 RepID=A0A6G1HJ02_9PEZI|nr:hypothetical protein EJ06DRAFT_252969 [Trichodelitschia bisporula]